MRNEEGPKGLKHVQLNMLTHRTYGLVTCCPTDASVALHYLCFVHRTVAGLILQ